MVWDSRRLGEEGGGRAILLCTLVPKLELAGSSFAVVLGFVFCILFVCFFAG